MLKEFPQIEVVTYDKKTEVLKESNIVVSATSSPHLVVRASELSGISEMTLLDLAAPRDIENQQVTLGELLLLTLTG